MRPVGKISTKTTLALGNKFFPVNMPVFISPAGLHGLCDPQYGECATARAAAKANILFGLSVSTRT